MSKPIRLHWSRSKPNFGDWLSPALCEMLSGRPVAYASVERCDLVAVGSLFGRLPRRPWSRTLDVWGTGSLGPVKARRWKHRFHAVRGPRTAGLIMAAGIPVLGDPGLLAGRLLPESPVPRVRDLAIVPHYRDADLPALAHLLERFPGARVVDVFESPRTVVRRLAESGFVLSSSLHGLVVADGLGIPSAWMRLSGRIRGGDWKFQDHYAALGLPPVQPYTLQQLLAASLDDLHREHRPRNVQPIQDALAAAFPYQ